ETDEKTRIKRIKSRPGSTPEDLTPKIPKSFFYLMEKAFESYKPIIIDNSKMNLKETIDKVMKIIGF
ncbi:MAG: hypothetical protein Q8L36_02315, partial [bacterium]|nr:hypothetical protein [bacterium]